jgi:hypothetical protein
VSSNLKVFVAGAPRSGTSILLFALKDVFGLEGHGESHVMPAFNTMIHASYEYLRSINAADRTVTKKMMVSGLNLPDIKAHLSEFIRRFYLERFPDGSWVDKTPSPAGVFSLVLVQEVFPDARLIVNYRNGIEVVSSHVKKFNATFEEACNVWRSAMDGLTRIKPLCKNLLAVDQYDFSNATDHVARQIARHLGRADKVDDLARYLRSERVENSSTHDWSKRLTLADASWSESEKETFRQKCGATMSEYGYTM